MKRTPLKRYRGFRGRNKFGAVPVHDLATGQSWDSKGEARRWAMLQLLQRTGAITILTMHPLVVLIERTDRAPRIAYHPDFQYQEAGRTVWED